LNRQKQQWIATKIAKSRDACAVQATSLCNNVHQHVSIGFCQIWPALHRNNVFASSNSGISRHANNADVCNKK